MEYRELIRHSLAVPWVIQERNKSHATAQRLRQRAGLPNAEGAVDLCSRVISATLQALENGDVDALFGGWGSMNDVTDSIRERLPGELPEKETVHSIEMLLTAVKHWADTNDPGAVVHTTPTG